MKKCGAFLTAAVLLAAVLTGCQSTQKESGPEEMTIPEEFAAFSYTAAETDADVRITAGFSGDGLYYVQHSSTGYELYVSDMDTRQSEKIYEESDEGRPPCVAKLSAASNHLAALLKYKGGGTKETASEREYSVVVLKSDKTVQAEYDVTEHLGGEARVTSMLADASGSVYLALDGEKPCIMAFDPTGALLHAFASEYRINNLFTDDDGHIYCACFSSEAAGRRLRLLELQTPEKSLKEICQYAVEDGTVRFAGNGGTLLFSEGESLYWLDVKSGEKKEILRWLDMNIVSEDIKELVLRDNGDIGIYRSYADAQNGRLCYEVTLLRDAAKGSFPADAADQADAFGSSTDQTDMSGSSADQTNASGSLAEETKEQIVLTYATMRLEDVWMKPWIVNYNKEHPECRIEVIEYGGEGTEAGLMRLNADIVSGKVPDIIDLDGINIGPYISKGILTDLYPFMDADEEMGREEFVPGILKQYEEDGKLYGIMTGYRLETLMGKESVVGMPSEWTVERMRDVLAKVPEGGCFVDHLSAMGLLRILLQKGMDEYLDLENGTCSFDGEKFIETLKLANSLETVMMDGDMAENLSSGKTLVNRVFVHGVSDYISSRELFHDEKVSCVGYPSGRGGSALVYNAFCPVGISSLNGHEDMAWEFVRTLLGEEFQTKNSTRSLLPIRLSVLQKQIDEQIKQIEKKREKEGTELVFTQEDRDAFYEMINVSNGTSTYDSNIMSIIWEEAEFYFQGQKSAEEAAKIIQNRASIYVSENY